jgi:hypothetical protein
MNRVVSSTVSPGDEEKLDLLLAAYFKSQLPDPWPEFRPPQRAQVLPFPKDGTSSKPFRLGSRLALAASVGLLFVGGWWLGGTTAPEIKPLPKLEGAGRADKPLPPLSPTPREADRAPAGKVKSSLSLEQGEEGTGITITVEAPPSNK